MFQIKQISDNSSLLLAKDIRYNVFAKNKELIQKQTGITKKVSTIWLLWIIKPLQLLGGEALGE